MRTDKAKELALHCYEYVTPVCNSYPHDRTSVLVELQRLVSAELNRISASDPARNK